MIKALSSLTALLLCLKLASPADANQEVKRDYYCNGRLKCEQPVNNGQPDGITKSYYENGILKSEAAFKDGRENGFYKEYNDKGTLLFDARFDNGTVDGVVNTFHENGKLQSKIDYQGCSLNGKGYFENGRSLFEVHFDTASGFNIFTSYFASGMPHIKTQFKDEDRKGAYPVMISSEGTIVFDPAIVKVTGLYKYFYPDGRLAAELLYKKGKKNGLRKEYFSNGQLSSECRYADDKEEGICREHFENGQLKLKANYRQGKKTGEYILYHKPGLLAESASYDNGTRQGITRIYYENGKSQKQTNYLNGLKEGIALEFCEEGRLRFVDTYKHNQIIHRRILGKNENILFEQEYPYRNWTCINCKINGQVGVYNKQNDSLEAIDTYDNGTITQRMIYDAKGKYRKTLNRPIIESAEQ